MKRGDASKHQAVEWKCCPVESCKTPVMSTLRYANTAKQILRDMNRLKTQEGYFLRSHLRQKMKLELSQVDYEELKRNGLNIARIKDSDKDVTVQKYYVCALSAVSAIEAQKEIKLFLSLADVHNTVAIEQLKFLSSQAKDFISWISNHQGARKLTDQMILDMTAESRKLSLLKTYYELKCSQGFHLPSIFTGKQEGNGDEQLLKKVLEAKKYNYELSESEQQSMIEALQCIIDAPWKRISLTKEEEDKIMSEIGAKPGVWYRCPEGHYYNVSECSGEEEVGSYRCPEC